MNTIESLIAVGFALLVGQTAISEWRGRRSGLSAAAQSRPLYLFARRSIVIQEIGIVLFAVIAVVPAARTVCGALLLFVVGPLVITMWRFGRPRFLIPPPLR